MSLSPTSQGAEKIRSVSRAAVILRCFFDGKVHGITELAAQTGLGVTTVHRLTRTLVEEGFLEQSTNDRTYRLGLLSAVLGRVALDHIVGSRAEQILLALRDSIGTAVSLGVPGTHAAFILLRFSADSALREAQTGLQGAPPHACVLGKLFLAYGALDRSVVGPEPYERLASGTITSSEALDEELARIRERGYATIRNEVRDDVCGLAVPVRDGEGRVTAAVSTFGSERRFDSAFVAAALPKLRRAASALTTTEVIERSAASAGV